jgi:hypothetical protein
MRILAAATAFIILAGLTGAMSLNTAKADDAGIIRISSVRISSRFTQAGTLQQFVLKNYAITSTNIGNAHLICTNVGASRGPAPVGARFCWGDYSIGNSSLQVQGLARSIFVFELAIVGGIGDYHGYGGTLKIVRYADNPVRERLVFRLTK